MDIFASIALAALMGGILCTVAQLLIDLTSLTPARILTLYVSLGVLIYALGAYDLLFSIFGEGVALPLIGFGGAIAGGVEESVMNDGALGILTGGLTATSAGITLALILGLFASLICGKRPKRM